MYDVVIAGGGIAGLSAALILGRCRRSVLICDTGTPRNSSSRALHGFLSRDGVHPLELRRIAREQLAGYPSVIFREIAITDADATPAGYRIMLQDGSAVEGRFFLLATGIVDHLPEVAGLAELYGTSVFHCPYCDGWEMRDQPLVVYGAGTPGCDYALELVNWSSDIVLCLNGGEHPSAEEAELLRRNGVDIREERIARLEASNGILQRIRFEEGDSIPCRALFFSPAQAQPSPLAEKLGCTVTAGVVKTAKFQQTAERMFVAGDAARSVQLAIVAAAEGAEAAFAINTAIMKERVREKGDR